MRSISGTRWNTGSGWPARKKICASIKRLEQAQRRMGELDRLFICRIYEDNVAGKITDERFSMMSQSYEDEQDAAQGGNPDFTAGY